MTRRKIVFQDTKSRIWISAEFNGDKTEFEYFGSKDKCTANWDEILQCFFNVYSLKDFTAANVKAQGFYFSCLGKSEPAPVVQIEDMRIQSDEVYIIKNGLTVLREPKGEPHGQ